MRPAETCISSLPADGERSHRHRVDAAAIRPVHAGTPLELSLAPDAAGPARAVALGPDLATGARPQTVVPEGWLQPARSIGARTLAGCTVSSGLRFEGFERAPPGFDTPRAG